MANPDVAMAFQNPRVQAAIMDVSPNSCTYFIHTFLLSNALSFFTVFAESFEYCKISERQGGMVVTSSAIFVIAMGF